MNFLNIDHKQQPDQTFNEHFSMENRCYLQSGRTKEQNYEAAEIDASSHWHCLTAAK